MLACSISENMNEAEGRDGFTGASEPGVRKQGQTGASSSSSGAVVLSIEPAVVAPGTETPVPVIFPGYVLPDDSLEDRAHEGS
jgi:hypothetical protein